MIPEEECIMAGKHGSRLPTQEADERSHLQTIKQETELEVGQSYELSKPVQICAWNSSSYFNLLLMSKICIPSYQHDFCCLDTYGKITHNTANINTGL